MTNKKMIHRITIKSLFSACLKSDSFPIELVNNGKANSMHLLIVMKCFSLFHTNTSSLIIFMSSRWKLSNLITCKQI